MKILGERIRVQRETHGISQFDFAVMLRVSQATVSRYEHGWNNPSMESLVLIAVIFEVSTDYLLGLSDV